MKCNRYGRYSNTRLVSVCMTIVLLILEAATSQISKPALGQSAPTKFMTFPFDRDVPVHQGWVYDDGSRHDGIDYLCVENTPLRAVADGVAMYSQESPNLAVGFGRFVLINHENGWFTLYAHVNAASNGIPRKDKHDTQYETWQRVKRGDIIALSGNNGHSDAPHLHLSVFRGGYALNPTDPYDIRASSPKASEYPPNPGKQCGPNSLWTTCPPSLPSLTLSSPPQGLPTAGKCTTLECGKPAGTTHEISFYDRVGTLIRKTGALVGKEYNYLATHPGYVKAVVRIVAPLLPLPSRTIGQPRVSQLNATATLRIRGQSTVASDTVEFDVVDPSNGNTFPVGRRTNDPNDILEMTDAYNAVGGANALGRPLGAVFQGANSGASNVQCELQEFESGNIYRWKTSGVRPANAAYVVKGSIYASWFAQGRQTGTLGMPISNEQAAQGSPTGVIAIQQDFEGGRILALPDRPQAYFVVGAIDAAWARSGRQTGPLGLPISEEYVAAPSPTGVTCKIQEFERGCIYKHTSGGLSEQAFAVVDAFASKYFSMGRSTSLLGLPMDDDRDEAQSIAGTGVKKQQFERGFLIKHTTGALNGRVFALSEAILQKWQGSSGTTGRLGAPTGDRQVVENSTGTASGFLQEFETGGAIVTIGTEATSPTYTVLDKMYSEWGALQRELGLLGFPTEDEREESQSINGTALNVQKFEGGQLLRHRSGARNGQVFSVIGPFQQKWAVDLHGTTGPLGAPIEDERNEAQSINGTGLRVQKFESGQILKHTTGTRNGQAFALYGKIEQRWAVEFHGTTGPFGAPATDLIEEATVSQTSGFATHARAASFENGGIMQHRTGIHAGQTYALWGELWNKYVGKDGAGGILGLPITDLIDEGTVSQTSGFATHSRDVSFENGGIIQHKSGSRTGQSFVVYGDLWNKYVNRDGAGGILGLPITDVIEEGTVSQTSGFATHSRVVSFENGGIIQHKTGSRTGTTYTVEAGIWRRYVSLDGVGGSLGLPIDDARDVNGARRQQFEGGPLGASSLVIAPGVGTLALTTTGTFSRSDLGLQDVRLAAWNAATQQYVFDDNVGSLRSGIGYWSRAATLRTAEPTGTEVTGPFTISLSGRGWNFVSSPYGTALPWSSQLIRVRRSGEEKTLAQAYDAVWIENCAWYWQPDANNPETGAYVPVCDGTPIPNAVIQLPALRGFWIFSYVDCELVLLSPPAANASRTLARRSVRIDGWMAKLSAELGDARDVVYFGGVTSDRWGHGLRFSKPPAAPIQSPLELFLVSRDGRSRLGADVRASVVNREAWQFVVRASRPNGEVTLRWADLGSAPRSIRFYLIDETTGARRYMRTSTAYSFHTGASSEERRFRVEVDTSPPERLVSQFNILSSDALTGARLSVVLSKAATLDARILTPSGKVAVVIARSMAARSGLNSLSWNGKNASGSTLPRGVYLVEVLVTDDEGQQVKAIRSAVMK